MVHEGAVFTEETTLNQLTIRKRDSRTRVPVVTFNSATWSRCEVPNLYASLQSYSVTNSAGWIVAGEVSYSNAPDDGRSWRQVLLEELGDRTPKAPSFVWAHPPSSCRSFTDAALHVYLSKAFSLKEPARNHGKRHTSAAEANPMMEELIQSVNGALWRGDADSLGK